MTEYIAGANQALLLSALQTNVSTKIVAVSIDRLGEIRVKTGIPDANGTYIGNPLTSAELTLLTNYLNSATFLASLRFIVIVAQNT